MGWQIAMQLLDMIFGETNVFPGTINKLYSVGVAGSFLLIPSCKGSNLNSRKQLLYLMV